MPLQKQNLNINFAQGLQTKVDPFQISPGQFLSLTNTIFTKAGLLQKRNGFPALQALPDDTYNSITTFNGDLTAIGTSFAALSPNQEWVNKGHFQSVQLTTLPLINSNLSQSQADSAIASNGLICTVFTDNPSGGAVYKYVIADSVTGQNIVAPTAIPVASGVVTGSPRVFYLGNNFIIVFTNVITAVNHLQYVSVNASSLVVSTNVNISSQYTPNARVNFDGVVANNSLYFAWNGNDGGGAVRTCFLNSNLILSATTVFAGSVATFLSMTADLTFGLPEIWIMFYTTGTTTGYAICLDTNLNTIVAPTAIFSAIGTVVNITGSAQNGVLNHYEEVQNAYSYDGAVPSNLIFTGSIDDLANVVASALYLRSIGLASKSFIYNDTRYFLAAYQSPFQSTFFLMNQSAQVVAKVAYGNGGGYKALGLPNVVLTDSVASIPYLFKNNIEASTSLGVYAQTGLKLANFDLGITKVVTAEIGNNLNLSGGFLWAYDGYKAVEQGFFLYPDSVEATTSTTGGSIGDGTYNYVATYEWSDNQGNIFRSAPSISIVRTTSGGGTSTNTINVPTLKLTYKLFNPIKLVVYRSSTAQPVFHQITSTSAPTLNDPFSSSIAITDTFADATIAGNNILYTTGGVVENIAAPATATMCLYKSRLIVLDAEDRNLLWYSKQVIESVPVEMSDLFTIYVAPTTSSQNDTGPITALSAMDDKLIIFKKDAIYYITGNGPDNTGANNDFSDPIFITSTVGCANQQSIVFIPNGLMFQSDKGIWLLGRDLSTSYIGSPVEQYNSSEVLSVLAVPATNQVRFTLDNNLILMYDYFYNQWGSFTGIPSIASTLFEGMHTFINSFGQVFQELPNTYLDGGSPVLISFQTGWFNLSGLQGYQRAYEFFLLGTFASPHKLSLQIAYDYSPSASQALIITPRNYSAPWGGDATWGTSTPWGGSPQLEQWRVFFQQQRCQNFQITLTEYFDGSFGTTPGAGLTLSGINLVFGQKKGFFPPQASQSVG